jgi:hypothetical protein
VDIWKVQIHNFYSTSNNLLQTTELRPTTKFVLENVEMSHISSVNQELIFWYHKVSLQYFWYQEVLQVQWAPLNVIALGHTKTDNINWKIITDVKFY